MKKRTILILGTLDSRGPETNFVKERIKELGYDTLVMNMGVFDAKGCDADISNEELSAASDMDIKEALRKKDRQQAVAIMAQGAKRKTRELCEDRKFDGVFALGGVTSAFMGIDVMRVVPIGIPKFIVTSMMVPEMIHLTNGKDFIMMQAVADIDGLNDITREILSQAAGCICGMVGGLLVSEKAKPMVAVTNLGPTTKSADFAKEILEEKGFQAVIIHSQGHGKTALEELINQDRFVGILDLTTHEIIDHIAGGFCGNIGPERLETAGDKGIPQVIGPGGLDVITFTRGTLPENMQERQLHEYDDSRVAARSHSPELITAARYIADKLKEIQGSAKVLLPLKGWSEASNEGGPCHNPKFNKVFCEEIKKLLWHVPQVQVVEVDANLTDRYYAETAVGLLEEMMASNH